MARYIDADLLHIKMEDLYEHHIEMRNFSADGAVADCLDMLDNTPTEDVEEVKHGEWLPVQYTYFGLKRYECSECKDDEYWQKRYLEHKEKYCPNCGAKMDGGKEE